MPWTAEKTWNTGDVLPASDLNTYVRDNIAFLHDQGGDLASATTITPSTQFHKVTGTTQIDNFTALAAGARLLLWFTGALTIRNNGGGTGNIRTIGSTSVTTSANTFIMFVSDGTLWYQITSGAGGGGGGAAGTLDFATTTSNKTTTATTQGTATTIVAGTSLAYDASPKRIECFMPNAWFSGGTGTMTFVISRGGTFLGQVPYDNTANGAGNPIYICIEDPPTAGGTAPSAGTYQYKLAFFVSGNTGNISNGSGGSGATAPSNLQVTYA